MKKTNWTLFIAALLLIVNIVLLYRIVDHKRIIAAYQAILTENTNKTNNREWLNLNFDSGLENNGIKLDNVIVRDSQNKEMRLQDLFKSGRSQVLVSRFTSLCCESCAIYSIQKACSFADSINTENIVFLGFYENTKILNLLKQQYGIHKKEVYNTMDFFNIPVEKQSYPYYFVLGRDLKISDVFLPDKMCPDLTNRYLDRVAKKYFKQKQ